MNSKFYPMTYLKALYLHQKNSSMAQVYIGLGTNRGDKAANLHTAIALLEDGVGEVLALSTFYASKPWGFESEHEFLNAVLLLKTDLTPYQLLSKTQEIEQLMGRTKKTTLTYEDRVMDIDILLYDGLVLNEPTLKIPHPLMVERDFVLIPLLELAPNLVHPLLNKPFAEFI